MNESDREMFNSFLDGLAATYGKQIDTPQRTVMFIGLADLSLDQYKIAVQKAVRQCEFFPTVAKLRDLAIGKPPAQLAWMSVCKAIRTCGPYRSVNFQDRLINAVIRAMGGWEAVCDLSEKELNSFAWHRFEKAYLALQDARLTSEQAAHLVGIHERRNRAGGFENRFADNPNIDTGAKPVAIGSDYEPPRLEYKRKPQPIVEGIVQQRRIGSDV